MQIALFALGICGLSVAGWDVVAGGFHFVVFGIRVSSWEAYKPFRIAMGALTAAFWLHDRAAEPNRTSWQILPQWAPWIAGGSAAISVAVAVHFGIFAAGGADAYGYVSQASLWAEGRIVAPDPLASFVPVIGRAVAPLGYVLGRTPSVLVPVYPPGLPLAMALALEIGGKAAVYYVVPILGGLAVWLTYLLGARVAGPVSGMIAAVLLAFSPLFLFHTLEPMSDVPVTAWWLLAWVLALSRGRWTQVGAGLAVSAAALTRPNLVPLAIVLVVVVAATKPRLSRLALFAAGSIPGCLVVAAVNAYRYGSPVASGYGSLESLYAWSHWRENLPRYVGWLIEINSPVILLAFIAPLVARVRMSIHMLVFFGILLACYLFYLVFDGWPFLRFLLPALPLLFVLSSAVIVRGLELVSSAFRGAAVFLLCVLLPLWYVIKADSLTVFDIQRAEHRYRAVGETIGRTLPPHAIVMSVIQSGSVRLYSGRMTVRWDMLEPARFDEVIDLMWRAGHTPYLLLEDWEAPAFQQRFGTASPYSGLDWPPVIEYKDSSRVRVYSFADRARHRAGEPIATRFVTYER